MKITYAELKRRLSSERNIANGVEFRLTRGADHRTGRNNTPAPIRDIISTLANVPGAKTVDIAAEFGVSHQTVSDYKNGKNGGHGSFKPDEKAETIEQIKDLALKKLMQSLGLISEEKLTDCDAKTLSGIAANISRVHGALNPVQSAGDQVNLVVYSPQLREESKYKIVDVET